MAMNDKKIYAGLFIFMFTIISLGFVCAQNTIQFNPGDLVNITGIKCLQQNGTLCPDTILCNITVINDTQDFSVLNQQMINIANAFRNYNIGYAPNYTATWSAVVTCSNGGLEEFVIEIGETATNWETAFILGMVGLIFLYAFIGFYIFEKEYWLIKSFLYFASLGMLIILINSAKILAIGSDSDKIITVGFTIAIVVLLVMFLYLFIFFLIEILKSLKEKRGVRWKF